MDTTVLNTIITASVTLIGVLLGAIIQPLFKFLMKKYEQENFEKQQLREANKRNYEEKRKIYIGVLGIMRQMEIGFSLDVDPNFKNEHIEEFIKKFNKDSEEILPAFMIVSTENIYLFYKKLIDSYGVYVTPNCDGLALLEGSKRDFSIV